MKPHKIADLNQLYSEGESADQELYAEQRSNVALSAGEHYLKRGDKFWNRIRSNQKLDNEQKIRLTKNHIRRIVHIYRNSITSYAPGVTASAKDKSSLQHQKAAELVNAVWQDAKSKQDINSKINQWANDYVTIGEVIVKIFFDPNKGQFLGAEAKLDENGNVELDENGQPVPGDVNKFTGEIQMERVFGFNLIRPAGVKDMNQAPWLCLRKMAKISEVKALIDQNPNLDDEEKDRLKQKVVGSKDDTFVVLDGNSGKYKQAKDECLLKEFYFRPSPDMPNGYFYICSESDILFSGSLPYGVFPLVYRGFDEIQTSPRHRSIIRQLRPNQIEINRCASKIAEVQVSSDDKVLIQNGTKITPGMNYPGIRSFNYSGVPPILMEGRSGDQYLTYLQTQISEMYQIAMVEEQLAEKETQGMDALALLSRSIKDKKRFSLYTDGFEAFLKDVFKTYVTLAQKYLGPYHLIPALGRTEYINVDEFKNVPEICYSINIEAKTDDSETKLGKQLMLSNIIQYVGQQLSKEDLGKVIRLMPYANDEMILEDLTMDYDFATNTMLRLDRGQPAVVNKYISPDYMINKLTSRTVKPDYEFLSPQSKMLYQQAIQAYEQVKAEQAMALKQAQSEFIPSGGFLVAADYYTPSSDPNKLPKRVRLPSESIEWLLKQLESQGSGQQQLAKLSPGAQGDIAQMLLQGQQAPQAPNAQMPMQQNAQTSAGGF